MQIHMNIQGLVQFGSDGCILIRTSIKWRIRWLYIVIHSRHDSVTRLFEFGKSRCWAICQVCFPECSCDDNGRWVWGVSLFWDRTFPEAVNAEGSSFHARVWWVQGSWINTELGSSPLRYMLHRLLHRLPLKKRRRHVFVAPSPKTKSQDWMKRKTNPRYRLFVALVAPTRSIGNNCSWLAVILSFEFTCSSPPLWCVNVFKVRRLVHEEIIFTICTRTEWAASQGSIVCISPCCLASMMKANLHRITPRWSSMMNVRSCTTIWEIPAGVVDWRIPRLDWISYCVCVCVCSPNVPDVMIWQKNKLNRSEILVDANSHNLLSPSDLVFILPHGSEAKCFIEHHMYMSVSHWWHNIKLNIFRSCGDES